MADQGRPDFCVVFTMNLCALELKQMLISFKLDKQALRSYLKLTCEYELHILPNTKVSAAKGHGKNYMEVIVSVIVYSSLLHYFGLKK